MSNVDDLIGRAQEQIRPCIRLERASRRSSSYIGGLPELPEHVSWPVWNKPIVGEDLPPLSFLAQIDLGEEPKEHWPDWMPKEGKLLFFYDAEQSTWGFDPADHGSWTVLFVEGSERCAERAAPEALANYARYPRKDVSLVQGQSVPSYERIGGYAAKLSKDEFAEIDARYEKLEREYSSEGPGHQLFGWPRPVQGDGMQLECQLVSNGVYCGNPDGYKSKEAKTLRPSAADWELLLQLDSDDDAGMMWGDLGKLYFWIRREDAKHRDFSNVWMILQCY